MYKNRYFLFGLGIGFILCGIILIISNEGFIPFNSTEKNFASDELTIEELKEIAKEKNLYLYTEVELNEVIKDSLDKQVDENLNNNVENKDEENTVETEVVEETNLIKFTIPYGMDSFEVADYLFNVGVLKDREMFQQILSNNGLTKKIISGEYEAGDLSVEELIELITNIKLEN